MRLHFRKTIGRYKKGGIYEVRDSLARVYLRANIARPDYEQKVIAEPSYEQKVIAEPSYEQKVIVDSVAKAELTETPVPDVTDEFDDMTVEELRIVAIERNVKVHWNAGAEKIKEALRKGND